MGSSTKTVEQKQDPWAPAQPYLKQALELGGQAAGSTFNSPSLAGLSDATRAGWDQSISNAQGGMTTALAGTAGTNFGSTLGNGGLSTQQIGAQGGIADALARFNTGTQQGMDNLNPYASGEYLKAPNPYLQRAVATSMQDAADGVNSQFSAAGRYGSGAQTRVLADRLGSIANNAYLGDYNQQQQNQLAAINAQAGINQAGFSGNLQGQGAIAGLGQQGIANTGAITSALPTLNQAQNLDAGNLVSTGGQQMAYNQEGIDRTNQDPWTKANALSGVASGIGALGMTGTQTTTQSGGSPFGYLLGGLGALKNLGGLGGIFSDERMKENIKEVGALNDGQKIYAYNYKGDNHPQIGLLAQEVEKIAPEAVSEDKSSGMKMVRYDKATARAAQMKKGAR